VTLDKGGRICLPEAMAKAAVIDKEAMLVGLVDRFEIWNPERYWPRVRSMTSCCLRRSNLFEAYEADEIVKHEQKFRRRRNQPGRYKMAEQGLLPKFAPMGRPVSLAPKRRSDEPAPRQEANGTPKIPLRSLQQQFFQVVQPVTEPVKAVASTPRTAVCVNAIDARRIGFVWATNRLSTGPRERKTSDAGETELSLDAVNR